MTIIESLQGIGFSVAMGILFSMFYHCLSHIIIMFRIKIIKLIMSIFIGMCFGCGYYYGLLMINDGQIRIYFLVALLFGYIFYCQYLSMYWVIVVKYCESLISYLFSKCKVVIVRLYSIMKQRKKVKRCKEEI